MRELGQSGRFAMHLLLCILDQPTSGISRWWIASDQEPIGGPGSQFSEAKIEAFTSLPPPNPSWLA
ncbi:hypothetical protein, partial [Kocuria marina]|uniref:hypothetical protein n=1 Tax=Kocuria marina TaxID=223184 RepID=UPI001EE47309